MAESFKYEGNKGQGGDLHQKAGDGYPTMTTAQGVLYTMTRIH